MDINNVTLTGRLIKDCTFKTIEYENAQYHLYDIAISTENGTRLENGYYDTDIYNVEHWKRVQNGNTGERFAQSLKKGVKIAIVGKLKKSSYTDKDGIKKTVVKIIANTVKIYFDNNSNDNNDNNDNNVDPVF